jgi:hypothetical protein
MWDSGVRSALKRAAIAEGCDFLGLGPHSLRRANITWRQEVGGSSIETSQIAGHANTKITEEYTVVQLRRQEELTRRIQAKRAKAGKRNGGKIVEIPTAGTADIMFRAPEISSAVRSSFRAWFASPRLPRGRVSSRHFVA